MNKTEVIKLRLNDNAVLHLRRDKIIATVSSPSNKTTDLYIEGFPTPFHINSNITEAIWED